MDTQTPKIVPLCDNPRDLDLKTLLATLEERARIRADGQLAIMRLATGWKVMIGTPDFSYRSEVEALPTHPSLYEAILWVLSAGR